MSVDIVVGKQLVHRPGVLCSGVVLDQSLAIAQSSVASGYTCSCTWPVSRTLGRDTCGNIYTIRCMQVAAALGVPDRQYHGSRYGFRGLPRR